MKRETLHPDGHYKLTIDKYGAVILKFETVNHDGDMDWIPQHYIKLEDLSTITELLNQAQMKVML